jgi:hypothetical protein
MDVDTLEIVPDCGRRHPAFDQFPPGLDKDVDEVRPELEDAVLSAIAAGDAGIEYLGESLGGFDIAVEHTSKQPHSAAGRIRLEPELPVGGAIEIAVVARELAIAAAEASMDEVLIFHIIPPSCRDS